MIRTRLFLNFGFLIVGIVLLSSFIGVQVTRKQIIQRAENQVRSDLNSAWSVLNSEMEKIETVLRLAVDNHDLVDAGMKKEWDDTELRSLLEILRVRFELDFLSIVSPSGKVVLRTAPPYHIGDYMLTQPAVEGALKGEEVSTLTLLPVQKLRHENEDLSEQAFVTFEETPRARLIQKEFESRGMTVMSAVPLMRHNQILGAVYGGVLLNRNEKLVTKIKESVFRNEKYNGTSIGSVTIFLHDCRISTTVRDKNGLIAIGTRVSKEVADRVLDNGLSWLGRAFVVNDWYLTAYDPIRNARNEVIGMLFVGILEKPFTNMIKNILMQFVALLLGGLVLTLVVAYLMASHISKPLHLLAQQTNRLRKGEKPQKVDYAKCSLETQSLIDGFNDMAAELVQREASLKEVNTSLSALNKSYMETLGFISHELKTPLGCIMNYVYLLSECKLGDLNERQLNAIKKVDINAKRITEMVRHYLNLSRIENKELSPRRTRLDVNTEIIKPLIDSFELSAQERNVEIINNIPSDTLIHADYNMTTEVFENMVSNAIKYGNENGFITMSSRKIGDKVEFRVKNTGNGIPKEHQSTIFNKFSRVDNSPEGKKKRGSGLGLFITKHIVTAHGGEISLQSVEGQYTEFIFTLPVYHTEDKGVLQNG